MSLTDAEYAYLRSQIGEVERSDLNARHQRLGSVNAVAIEILRERKAALVSDPLTITVQGVATVNNAENVKALERQITDLEVTTEARHPCVAPTPLRRRSAR
ncbi:hypothetical protein [Streptomyces flaveus]|uniref:Uncharacterized protein n=1 Tax=Streptomyces flaveus TaxID=66370 RepID=A0A917VQ14_9ACTN|nr:hypothetical protein [Streptomyces flaveus]GGL03164.1 hypothetical protein GCM10010094_74950 [Streptomyces flaveus]